MALVISALTYFDFRLRTPDELVLSGKKGMEHGLVEVYEENNYDLITNVWHPIVGPTAFQIQVFNPSDRTVVITDWQVISLNAENKSNWYFGMEPEILNMESEEPTSIPLEIPPGQVRFYWLSLYIPIITTDEQRMNCLTGGRSLDEIESCFYKYGTDIFGNYIEKDYYGPGLHRKSFSAKDGPAFELEVETADGTTEKILLTYYN